MQTLNVLRSIVFMTIITMTFPYRCHPLVRAPYTIKDPIVNVAGVRDRLVLSDPAFFSTSAPGSGCVP